MQETTEQILGQLERREIGRREAAVKLGALMMAALAAPRVAAAEAESGATFDTVGLNHIALRVTDVARSRDFYAKHLGLTVLSDDTPRNCFMGSGDNFVALFRSSTPGLDHYCYTIPNYDAGRVVETLRAAELEPSRHSNRVYFDDPDGLTVQLAGRRSSWPG